MHKDSPYREAKTFRFAYNKIGKVCTDVTSRRVRATTAAMEKQ